MQWVRSGAAPSNVTSRAPPTRSTTTTQHASLWSGKARPVAHTKITIAFLDRKNPPGFSSGHTQSPKANSQTPKKTRRRDDERGSAQLFFILKTRCLLHHASSFIILHASPLRVLLPLPLPLSLPLHHYYSTCH
jgi:hypothetical protein